MKGVNINALHNHQFKTGDIEKLVHTSKIYSQSRKYEIEHSQTHQEKSDTVLIGLIERSLGFDHASQPQICRCLTRLFWVLVDTAHALVTDVQDQANYLRRLGKQSSPLNNIIVIKLCGSRIII